MEETIQIRPQSQLVLLLVVKEHRLYRLVIHKCLSFPRGQFTFFRFLKSNLPWLKIVCHRKSKQNLTLILMFVKKGKKTLAITYICKSADCHPTLICCRNAKNFDQILVCLHHIYVFCQCSLVDFKCFVCQVFCQSIKKTPSLKCQHRKANIILSFFLLLSRYNL